MGYVGLKFKFRLSRSRVYQLWENRALVYVERTGSHVVLKFFCDGTDTTMRCNIPAVNRLTPSVNHVALLTLMIEPSTA
jgi:hypothetical protein